MSKKKNESDKNKSKFIMKGNPRGYFKNDTEINFRTPKNSPFYKKILDAPTFPKFNADRKYFTPTFVKSEQFMQLHSYLVSQSLNELQIDQIMIPKPKSQSKYCGVCRNKYQEYFDHIKSKEHLENLQNSQYQKIIIDECKKFMPENKNPQLILNQNMIDYNIKQNKPQ